MLLVSVWWRLLAAGIAIAGLWAAVLWVAPSTPSISSAEPPVRVAAPPVVVPVLASGGLRAVVQSGFPAPGGGRFDRFDVAAHPVAAPVNARGQVAFYATVLRSPAREGIFIAEGGQVRKLEHFCVRWDRIRHWRDSSGTRGAEPGRGAGRRFAIEPLWCARPPCAVAL